MKRAQFLSAGGLSVVAGVVSPASFNAGDRPRALVLSGGIAEGVYEAGVYKALRERGFDFDIVCGTSIGALNGALIAQGDADHLFDVWHGIAAADPPIIRFTDEAQSILRHAEVLVDQSRGVINRVAAAAWLRSAIGPSGARALRMKGIVNPAGARKILAAVDLTKMAASGTRFLFAATNATLGHAEGFYVGPKTRLPVEQLPALPIHQLNVDDPQHVEIFPELVRASGAFPIAFEPVAIPSFTTAGRTEYYLDGGVANNTPIRLARKVGARSAICVFLQPHAEPKAQPLTTSIDLLLQLYTANQQQLLDDEMLLASQFSRAVTDSLAPSASLPPPIALYQIRPSTRLQLDLQNQPFGFDKQALINADFDLGYSDGLRGPAAYTPPDYLR